MTNTRNIKQMVCAYCGYLSNDKKCMTCEFNPTHTNNFEIGDSAKLMIREGVMTADGCSNLVARLNTNRLDSIAGIFRDSLAVDSGAESVADSVDGGSNLHTASREDSEDD